MLFIVCSLLLDQLLFAETLRHVTSYMSVMAFALFVVISFLLYTGDLRTIVLPVIQTVASKSVAFLVFDNVCKLHVVQ